MQKFSLGPTSMRAVSALVPVSLGNKHQDDSYFTDRKVEAHENTAVRGLHLTGAPDASRASEGDAQSPRGPYPSPLAVSAAPAVGSDGNVPSRPLCWRLKLSALIPRGLSHPIQVTFIYSLARSVARINYSAPRKHFEHKKY